MNVYYTSLYFFTPLLLLRDGGGSAIATVCYPRGLRGQASMVAKKILPSLVAGTTEATSVDRQLLLPTLYSATTPAYRLV
jgi:phage-related tail protein